MGEEAELNRRNRCQCGRSNPHRPLTRHKLGHLVYLAPWCEEFLFTRRCRPLSPREYLDVDVQIGATRLPQEGLSALDEPVRPIVALLRSNDFLTVFSCQGRGTAYRPGYVALWHTINGRNDPEKAKALIAGHFPATNPRVALFRSHLLGLLPTIHLDLPPHVRRTPLVRAGDLEPNSVPLELFSGG